MDDIGPHKLAEDPIELPTSPTDALREHYGGSAIVFATSVPAKIEGVDDAETFIYIHKPELLNDPRKAYSFKIKFRIVTLGKYEDQSFPIDTFECAFTGTGIGEPEIIAVGKRLDLLPGHISGKLESDRSILEKWSHGGMGNESSWNEIGLFRAHHPEVDFEALAKQVEVIIQELLQREEIQAAVRKGIFGFEALQMCKIRRLNPIHASGIVIGACRSSPQKKSNS